MNKIFKRFSIIVLTFSLLSCAYEPIFSEKSYNFKTGKVILEGDKDINRIIKNKFDLIKNNVGKDNKIYDILIKSEKNKIIVAKDSKGDPKTYAMTINLNLEIDQNGAKRNNIFTESFGYNSKENKFDLKKYERNIQNNLSQKILENITLYLSTI